MEQFHFQLALAFKMCPFQFFREKRDGRFQKIKYTRNWSGARQPLHTHHQGCRKSHLGPIRSQFIKESSSI